MSTEGIMPPMVNHEITYEIRMKDTGPFRYFLPDLAQYGPEWHAKRIRELLGHQNVKALTVETGEDWMLVVALALVEPTFTKRRTIFGQPIDDAIAEVRDCLPQRHCESVNLLHYEEASLYEY